ncbi:MAG TPA: restriction endonuclease subunit S, partial [Saprospiraceae bacterium]|nr:restriction endonuclease subunit S [Saprospiraceae bacterium]
MSKVKLSSILDIISGGTPSTTISEYWENGTIGWLSVTDFNKDLRFVYDTDKKITEIGLKNSNTKMLEVGDIIISARGTVGALAQIGKPLSFNQSCFGLRGKKGIADNNYLYYCLKNYVHNIKKRSQGSVFDTINLNSFDLMEIDIHDLVSQQKIASVLSSLDFKIELNNRINAQLEQMAKTIYDYWFVQFDFPMSAEYAASIGQPELEGKPYKSSGGKMVWSDELKREVPAGCEVKLLSDWIEISKSGDWGKESLEGNYTEKVYCFRGADINGLNGLSELKPPTRYILEKNKSKILEANDLIVEISGGSPTQSTGRMAFITNATLKRFELPVICSNFCKPISLINKKLLYNFAYYWNSLYDNGIFF